MERKEMFYLTMHSTHFILRLYGVGHMVKDHSDSERNTYLGLWYTSCGALAGTRNSSMFPPWGIIVPWANILTMELHLVPGTQTHTFCSWTELVPMTIVHYNSLFTLNLSDLTSIYIHIMDTNINLKSYHHWNKSQKWGFGFLIS